MEFEYFLMKFELKQSTATRLAFENQIGAGRLVPLDFSWWRNRYIESKRIELMDKCTQQNSECQTVSWKTDTELAMHESQN